MRWPRGRFNGRRIEGFDLTFQLHLLWWRWRPRIAWNFGQPYIIWLCFSLRGQLSFASEAS